MAKEIIEHGNLRKKDVTYICDCRNCGCKFTFTVEDSFRSLTYYPNSVQCPECMAINNVDDCREYKPI